MIVASFLTGIVSSGQPGRRLDLLVGRIELPVENVLPDAAGEEEADAEDEPAPRDRVDGTGHVGEQLWIPVRIARHQRADLEAGGLFGPGAEHRPALEVLAIGVVVRTLAFVVQRIEVIPVVEDVDTEFLGHLLACFDVEAGEGDGPAATDTPTPPLTSPTAYPWLPWHFRHLGATTMRCMSRR